MKKKKQIKNTQLMMNWIELFTEENLMINM